MTLTNVPESATSHRRHRTLTDVVAPAPAAPATMKATETRDQNRALAIGAYEAGLENERHAELVVNGIREVLEPYDE
jgi:hypothetical protein